MVMRLAYENLALTQQERMHGPLPGADAPQGSLPDREGACRPTSGSGFGYLAGQLEGCGAWRVVVQPNLYSMRTSAMNRVLAALAFLGLGEFRDPPGAWQVSWFAQSRALSRRGRVLGCDTGRGSQTSARKTRTGPEFQQQGESST